MKVKRKKLKEALHSVEYGWMCWVDGKSSHGHGDLIRAIRILRDELGEEDTNTLWTRRYLNNEEI